MTADVSKPHDPGELRMRRTVRLTRANMVLTAGLRAFWPVAAFSAVVGSGLASGVVAGLGKSGLMGVFGLLGLGLAVLVWRGIMRFKWPSLADAEAVLDARIAGHPFAFLRDRPALGGDDPAARDLWQRHRDRMRARAMAARPKKPDLRLSRFDPLGLRLMAIVIAVIAFLYAPGFGFRDTIRGLAQSEVSTPSIVFEGWAEPPAYTGEPTRYLTSLPDKSVLELPQGTHITLRAYGARNPALRETISRSDEIQFSDASDGLATARLSVEQDGALQILDGEDVMREWRFSALIDTPPVISPASDVTRSAAGEMQFDFEAQDDYGIQMAQAEIALDLAAVDRRHGLAVAPDDFPDLILDLPLPISGGATAIEETFVEDVSKHPLAGLPVTMKLHAEDGAGQIGRYESVSTILPQKRFFNPLAAALIEQRRDLIWSLRNARRVTQVLRAITYHPEDVFNSPRAYLITRMAIRRLSAAIEQDGLVDARPEIAEALWKAAVIIEDGRLGDAAARLAEAQERLKEALQNGASDEEIAALMDELRQATQEYLEEMARQAIEQEEQQMAEAPPPGEAMSQDQIQQMLDEIQRLSDEGRKAEAEALLEQLQQMLENMQMRMTQQGQSGEGQQGMSGLNDALREQQDLADQSFQQMQRGFGQNPGQGNPQPGQPMPGGQGQQGQSQPGQPGQDRPGGDELADRQEALRELIDELRNSLSGSAGQDALDAMRDAERQMGEARDALRNDDMPRTLERQADAIEALREAMRGLAQDQQQAQGEGNAENGMAADGTTSRDPLGREANSRGGFGTNKNMLLDKDATQRAREILDEIRRRSGDRSRPEIELDYLRRLLERF